MQLMKVMIATCVSLIVGVTVSIAAFGQTGVTRTERIYKNKTHTSKSQAYKAQVDQSQNIPSGWGRGMPKAPGHESWDPFCPYASVPGTSCVGGSPNGI